MKKCDHDPVPDGHNADEQKPASENNALRYSAHDFTAENFHAIH